MPQPSFGSTNSITPGGTSAVDPFHPTAAAPVVAPAPKQAVIVTSGPARAATAENTSKLMQVTQPNLGPINPTQTRLDNRNTAASSTTTPTPTGDKAQIPEANMPAGGYSNGTSGNSSSTSDPTSSIKDPAIAAQMKTTLANIDSEVTQAQSNIDNVKARSLNDPAATAMVDQIKAKYDAQFKLLNARNTQLLGRASNANAAFGGLGEMSQNFLSEEQSKADQRVSDLQSQEDAAITKAQIAYQTQNFKDLNTAMDAYDKANKAKLDALNKLMTETDKSVKDMQAQQKLEMAQEKQAVTLDVTKSANLGNALAKQIADSGITDQSQIDSYIQSAAQEYGINNPDILRSAIEKARQTLLKTDVSAANTLDSIKNRDAGTDIKQQNANTSAERARISASKKGGGGSKPKFVTSTAISTATPQFEAHKGEDGYIDPAKWIAGRKNWQAEGGTEASYKSNFIKYLNPASYEKAGYKSPTKASGSSQYQLGK